MKVRKKILYIDDDAETASLMVEDLLERGFEALSVDNGRTGLALIQNWLPDLVLCDVGMPVMSGFELLEELTALGPYFHHIPFIFITALQDHDSEIKGWDLGADDYITKPVNYDALAVRIRARLAIVGRSALWRGQVDLRERELETLTWAARGKTFIEIGRILGLSARTVEFHIERARTKLGVATRTQALIKATVGNLIRP